MPNLDGSPTEQEQADSWLRTIAVDPFANAAGSVEVQKRQTLQALADAGTQGRKTFEEAQTAISQRQAQSLARAREAASAIGAPAGAVTEESINSPTGARIQALSQEQARFDSDLTRQRAAYEQYMGGIQGGLTSERANYRAAFELAQQEAARAAASGGGGGGGGEKKPEKAYLDTLSESELRRALEGRGAADQSRAFEAARTQTEQASGRLADRERGLARVRNTETQRQRQARAALPLAQAEDTRVRQAHRQARAAENVRSQRADTDIAAARRAFNQAQQAALNPSVGRRPAESAAALRNERAGAARAASAALRRLVQQNATANQAGQAQRASLAARQAETSRVLGASRQAQAPALGINVARAAAQMRDQRAGTQQMQAQVEDLASQPVNDYARRAALEAYNRGELTSIGPDAIAGLFPEETALEVENRRRAMFDRAMAGGELAARQQYFGTSDPAQLGYQATAQQLQAPEIAAQQTAVRREDELQAADDLNKALQTGELWPDQFAQAVIAQQNTETGYDETTTQNLIDTYYTEWTSRARNGWYGPEVQAELAKQEDPLA